MNYQQSLDYLNSYLNLERIHLEPDQRVWNLDRMKTLLDWFGHPESSFFPILIAGTKGKGSTGFFLESLIQENKIPVGFYSSPHLQTPRERIRIQGKMISKQDWVRGLKQVKSGLKNRALKQGLGCFTYFEIMTLLAMICFKRAGVKIGVFEVGLGGRLDATNSMDAQLAIITPIHMDHESFLGNTLRKIAREKSRIIRKGANVVLSPQKTEAMAEIMSWSRSQKAKVWKAASSNGAKLGLQGDYQRVNAGVALKAAEVLQLRHGFKFSARSAAKGLKRTGWPGRLEKIVGHPQYILDGAHNPAAIQALTREWTKSMAGADQTLIFGTTRDKQLKPMLKSLSQAFREIILVPVDNPRTQELSVLLGEARGQFNHVLIAEDSSEAMAFAESRVSRKGTVLVTGSFYLVGEVRERLKKSLGVREDYARN